MEENKLHALRHSAEHILTQAMEKLWPGQIIKAMGPAIETGFYFDFDTTNGLKITEADFPKIEKEMKKIVQLNMPFEKVIVTAEKTREMFKDNPYKQEWIDKAENLKEEISVYWTGDPGKGGSFVDVCAGPHVARTIEVKAFKLLSVAGAYWHGDEKNKMLTRIYGTAFETQEELDKYVWQLEEAKKRDHRKIGKEMDLFVFSDLVGPGLPLYTKKGAFVRKMLQDWTNELQKGIGYEEVWTPQMTKADLFKTSGHYDKYKESMFKVVSNYTDEEYFLKPMNCPMHTQIFASKSRSYRDMPVRISDFANLYRDEKPGELSGLTRLRCFSQDDGHCFCREDQIQEEFENVIKIIDAALKPFGMKYWTRLSLWDPLNKEKYLGAPEVWERSQRTLEDILTKNKIDYKKVEGEAAIYGPKMDIIAIDALGREWQISTIQLDMIMPVRFGLEYADSDGTMKTPVMIHRAILGSPERFMGLLLEHTAGNLPLWLSPVQVAILPISEKTMEYSESVMKKLQEKGIRVELNHDADSLGKKIRNAEASKVPYMLIIGEKEAEAKQISVRQRGQKDLGTMALNDFAERVKKEVEEKSL
jgi:threonyl-tRNA synthetase